MTPKLESLTTINSSVDVENGIYSGPATNTIGANTQIMWKTFTGITTATLNSNTLITHGIPNGRKRILSVTVNVQSDDTEITGVPNQSFIAGGGNMQDEKDPDQEYQTYYDDNKIYIHLDAGSSALNSNRYTVIVIYSSSDIY